jgi:hypothetical protein
MLIQEIAAMPADPLATFDDDYGKAVLHLVWNREGNGPTCIRSLLFAFVELLPQEVPAPPDDYDPRAGVRLTNDSTHHVHFRHAVVTARQGLDWYLNCRQGVALLPENDGTLPSNTTEGKHLEVGALDEVLPWPELRTAGGGDDTIPFCPRWIESPRVHQLLPVSAPAVMGKWSERDRAEANRAIENSLHFSIESYPEYLGSVHLIAPNPVFRQLTVYHPPRVHGGESVLLRFEPRAGRSVDSLVLFFEEQDAWGRNVARIEPVKGALLRVNFERAVCMVRKQAFDARRGLLGAEARWSVVVRRFATDLRLGSTLGVSGPEPGDGYDVARSSKAFGLTAGDEGGSISARTLMHEAYRRRAATAHASEHGQRWFRGNTDNARTYVRSLLHGARRRVLVVDAYTGAEELFTFLLAVGAEDVPIQVLTSAELLKKRQSATDPTKAKADILDANLNALRAARHMNSFEVRVMTGDRPVIHDRFLLLDDRLWLLGSSLNEFGSRGTMLVSVPDPGPIIPEISRIWEDAPRFEDWYRPRQELSARADVAGGGQPT